MLPCSHKVDIRLVCSWIFGQETPNLNDPYIRIVLLYYMIMHHSTEVTIVAIQYRSQITPRALAIKSQVTRMKLVPAREYIASVEHCEYSRLIYWLLHCCYNAYSYS